MKYLLFIGLFIGICFSQMTGLITAEDIFDGTDWEDFITKTTGYYTDENDNDHNIIYWESDTTSDTMVTKIIPHRAYADVSLYCTVLTDSADTTANGNALYDTMRSVWEIGVYTGEGTVPAQSIADSTGYYWKFLYTFTTDTCIKITLGDSTWFYKDPCSQYKLRWREATGAVKQRNRYYFNGHEFKLD